MQSTVTARVIADAVVTDTVIADAVVTDAVIAAAVVTDAVIADAVVTDAEWPGSPCLLAIDTLGYHIGTPSRRAVARLTDRAITH